MSILAALRSFGCSRPARNSSLTSRPEPRGTRLLDLTNNWMITYIRSVGKLKFYDLTVGHSVCQSDKTRYNQYVS